MFVPKRIPTNLPEALAIGTIAIIGILFTKKNNESSNNDTSNTSESEPEAEPEPERTGTGSESEPEAQATNGDDDPPKRNYNKKSNKDFESHWEAFLKFFKVISLEEISIRGVYIFRNLSKGQIKTLKSLIIQMRRQGSMRRILETILNIFNCFSKSDVTFQNFLSLAQFIMTYAGEKAVKENEKNCDLYSVFYDYRREEIFSMKYRSKKSKILDIFLKIHEEIEQYLASWNLSPSFRNTFSAVYHYFKHRRIPKTNDIFSVSEYFDLIEVMLSKVKTFPLFKSLLNGEIQQIIFERYFRRFGRRLRLVLKIQDGKLELSSCYFIDDVYEDDEDGDTFLRN